MASDDRVKAVQEARKMTTAQILEWRVKRRPDDSFRNDIVDWELKSRSTAAVYKAAIDAGLVGAVAGGGASHPLLALARQSAPPWPSALGRQRIEPIRQRRKRCYRLPSLGLSDSKSRLRCRQLLFQNLNVSL
jgi:hypothetical protein